MQDIISDIEWLKANNGSNDLYQRLQVSERLAVNSYYLATMVGEAYEKRNTSEYFYKTAVSSFMANSDLSMSKSESVAKDRYKDMLKEHLDADSYYKKLALLLQQVTIVIEQTRQTNSQLKNEMRHAAA